PKRPRHHTRKLFSPECVAVRSDPLRHDDVRTCVAQRGCPPPRVLEEERLQGACDKICTRHRSRQSFRWAVTRAWRGAEDCTVDVRMANPKGEREFPTRRDTEHRGALGGQRHCETRPHPSAEVLNK